MTYKPNFRTSLPWPKVLELLNKLLDYTVDSSSSNGEMEYILIKINDTTKDLICNLGIDLSKWEDDFYESEEGWFDITVLVWGEITYHYGHDIWYTGKEFIVYDKEKEELFKMADNVIDWYNNEYYQILRKGEMHLCQLEDAVLEVELFNKRKEQK